MDLHHFSSYYELIAALNFTFAGIEEFRAGLSFIPESKKTTEEGKIVADLKILNEDMEKALDDSLSELNVSWSKLIVDAAEIPTTGNSQAVKEEVERIYAQKTKVVADELKKDLDFLKEEIKSYKSKESEAVKFIEGFKSLFLIAGIYCVLVLLIEGYAQFYETRKHDICDFLCSSSVIFGFLYGIIFVRSFGSNFDKKLSEFKMIFIVFLAIILTIGLYVPINFYKDGKDCLPERIIITISISLSFSSFLIHLFRAGIHRISYPFRYFRLPRYVMKVKNKKVAITIKEIDEQTLSILKNFFAKEYAGRRPLKFYQKILLKINYYLYFLLDLILSYFILKF